MKTLTRELLLFVLSVVVLTSVLAVFNWRFGGPTYGASIGELGLKFGGTAYVIGAVVRLIFLALKSASLARRVRT